MYIIPLYIYRMYHLNTSAMFILYTQYTVANQSAIVPFNLHHVPWTSASPSISKVLHKESLSVPKGGKCEGIRWLGGTVGFSKFNGKHSPVNISARKPLRPGAELPKNMVYLGFIRTFSQTVTRHDRTSSKLKRCESSAGYGNVFCISCIPNLVPFFKVDSEQSVF